MSKLDHLFGSRMPLATPRSWLLLQRNGYQHTTLCANSGVPHLDEEQENVKRVFPSATYECVRCGTKVEGAELAKLPSPTCANCGYRVFRKVRMPVAKKLKGE
jgi:DNA-directed RNA polymerase subunit RPC12/RpoP